MKSLLRYPGSKWNLANAIVELLPEHKSYLEPYFGSGAVLFNKPSSPIETVNDLNVDIVNLFSMVRDRPEELAEKLFLIPYSRKIYDDVFTEQPADDLERAVNFVIKSVMSHGFRTIEKSGWEDDINGREKAYAVRHWNNLPDIIQDMTLRLKQVQIENRPALELIKRFDKEDVCMYIDPPYVLSTRTRKQYSFEMEDSDHVELLDTILKSKDKILISGYDCDLYNSKLVVVPKFVAVWAENTKKQNFSLRQALEHWSMSEELEKWFQYSYNQDTFARAWLDGYEMEQEKLYTVEIPSPNNDSLTVLEFISDSCIVLTQMESFPDNWKEMTIYQLTESEIKQDFEWAWDAGFAEPVEVEEVK